MSRVGWGWCWSAAADKGFISQRRISLPTAGRAQRIFEGDPTYRLNREKQDFFAISRSLRE